MTEQCEISDQTDKIKSSSNEPATVAFFMLIITLWALNLADLFQTLYLKQSGLLAQEANLFVNFFLEKSHLFFFMGKVLALILITSIISRGWFDKKGIKIGNLHYPRSQVRCSIYFLLSTGVIYYTIIVAFPFFAMLIAGWFSPSSQPPL
jgi:hypothetical protein